MSGAAAGTAINGLFDFVVIGGGIAAASVAYWLAPHARVAILERESQPGYHSTGRSAAIFVGSYGPPQVRALSMASRTFLDHPPAGFSDYPLLTPRGLLLVAHEHQQQQLRESWARVSAEDPEARLLDARGACSMVPALRPERVAGAVFEPGAADMDVHALHQGFLRGARRAGAHLECNADARAIRRDGDLWLVEAGGLTWRAPVLINAAGAWADAVATLAGVEPLGIEPRRRSAFVFPPPVGLDTAEWPMTAGMDTGWYFKPDAGMLLASPANADPVPPQDVQPEELDIALAVDRIESMTTLNIRRPARTWAGLRNFVADGSMVGGFDTDAPGFFWVTGQGGYGIQTAAAMGEACAALARGLDVPPALAAFGVDSQALGPARLRAFSGAAS